MEDYGNVTPNPKEVSEILSVFVSDVTCYELPTTVTILSSTCKYVSKLFIKNLWIIDPRPRYGHSFCPCQDGRTTDVRSFLRPKSKVLNIFINIPTLNLYIKNICIWNKIFILYIYILKLVFRVPRYCRSLYMVTQVSRDIFHEFLLGTSPDP